MKYLVYCTCGHALDRHNLEGCDGDGKLPCRCSKTEEGALESAIEHARSHPWGTVRPPEMTEAEIA